MATSQSPQNITSHKRYKLGESNEVGVVTSSIETKELDSPKNRSREDKFNLSKLRAIMKKPKKNITAYAFFIKEVSYQV